MSSYYSIVCWQTLDRGEVTSGAECGRMFSREEWCLLGNTEQCGTTCHEYSWKSECLNLLVQILIIPFGSFILSREQEATAAAEEERMEHFSRRERKQSERHREKKNPEENIKQMRNDDILSFVKYVGRHSTNKGPRLRINLICLTPSLKKWRQSQVFWHTQEIKYTQGERERARAVMLRFANSFSLLNNWMCFKFKFQNWLIHP